MAEYSDFRVGIDSDIVIQNGDIALGNGVENEVKEVMGLSQGELKVDPLLGPNLMRQLKGNSADKVRRLMKIHLKRDGKKVDSINLNKGTLKIQADYDK